MQSVHTYYSTYVHWQYYDLHSPSVNMSIRKHYEYLGMLILFYSI